MLAFFKRDKSYMIEDNTSGAKSSTQLRKRQTILSFHSLREDFASAVSNMHQIYYASINNVPRFFHCYPVLDWSDVIR